jgi:hypothetical protein
LRDSHLPSDRLPEPNDGLDDDPYYVYT